MNPETLPSPREELEIRLTAMLMGELSPEEADALQKQIAADSELAALHARLRQAIELLREASAIPEQPAPPVPAQLSSERREKLLAHFKAPAPAPSAVIVKPKRNWKWAVPLGIAALLIAFIGLLQIQYLQVRALVAGSGVSDPRGLRPSPPLSWFVPNSRSEAPGFQSEGGGLMADNSAESRWGAQPGAVRNFQAEANGRASGTASNGRNWMFWRKAPAQERGETTEPLADVSLASAGDSLAASNVEFDVDRAAQPEAVRRSVRFAEPAPAATPAPAAQLFARADDVSTAEPAARPARMPIYLGTESENAMAESAPAPRPEIAAITAPAPLAAFKLYSGSEVKTAEPAPVAAAFGNGVVNGGVPGSLSVGGKVQSPQGVAAVRGSTAALGNWDRGVSKHMDGALGDKVDDGNIALSDLPIVEPHAVSDPFSTAGKVNLTQRVEGFESATTGTVQLPKLTGLAPSAETKPAAPEASKPADSKRGRAVQWMDSDGDRLADISRDKDAPVSGPAPAEPPVSQVLARSFAGAGTQDVSGAAKGWEAREKLSVSDPKATRLDHFYTDLNAPVLADGTVASKLTSDGAGGGSALGLERLSRVEGDKGKASFNENFAYAVPDGGVTALGEAQKKLALTDVADGEMLHRNIVPGADVAARGGAVGGGANGNIASFGGRGIQGRDGTSFETGNRDEFGVTAGVEVTRLGNNFTTYSIDLGLSPAVREFEGFIAGEGTRDSRRAAGQKPQEARSQDWSGQVQPTAKNAPEDLVTKWVSGGVINGVKPNVELAFRTKTDDFTGVAEPGMEDGQKLAFVPQKSDAVYFQKEVQAEAAVRTKSKAAPPAKSASLAKESKVETRRLSEKVDELTTLAIENPVSQMVTKLDDKERVALNAVDFVERPAPATEESLKEVREMETVAAGVKGVEGRELVRRTVSQSRFRATTEEGKKALPETINKAKNDPAKRELAARTDDSKKGVKDVQRLSEESDSLALTVESKVREEMRSGSGKAGDDIAVVVTTGEKELAEMQAKPAEVSADTSESDRLVDSRSLITKEYKLKPGVSIAGRMDAKEFLISSGVSFPQGSDVTYLASSNRLIIRTSPESLGSVEKVLAGKAVAESPTAETVQKEVGEPKTVELAKLEQARKQVALKDSDEKPATPKPAEPAPVPQPEIATSANAFSTFSLNVSDVAFKLAGASLEKGQMPELATVRSEEFINAFDYRDPEPAPGAALACTTERARYPFAQNRDLVRFSVKTAAAGRQPGRALNLVLLLDNSGSMERADRVRILHESLRVLATQLQPQDKLSVVTFSRTPRLWADGVAGDKAGEVAARVGEITPQGGTNLGAALDLGYKTALKHYQPGSINRVVLLTDGAANLGDVNPDALKQKVEAHRKQGVALDCFGIGWEGYDDTLLEALSRNGDGRYGFINTPDEAATEFAAQLAGALRVAASDVKVQVEWNPRRVTSYRQIGYAKHQLKKEQFRDNTVDAAEIGAAESGNALYACEVNPRGEGDLGTVRVRFKVPGTSDYKEHEWTVPYTKDAPPLEQASPALRLAGTASAFSEWLVSSQYATEVTPDRLLGLLNGVPAIYGADPRPQKLEWMIRTAKSVSGR